MYPISRRDDAALNPPQLTASEYVAASNRARFDKYGVLAINLLSSTEAGKAALLEATIVALGHGYRIAVIEASRDTEQGTPRIRRRGMPTVHVKTVASSHLRASVVDTALKDLPLPGIDLLFMGNVGRLTDCADLDLGQHRTVTLLCSGDSEHSREEFRSVLSATDLVILSKAELLEVVPEFDADQAGVALRMLGRRTPMIQSVALRARTLAPWLQWLEKQLRSRRSKQPQRAPTIDGAAWS